VFNSGQIHAALLIVTARHAEDRHATEQSRPMLGR
jgi:hypothetical protein